MTQAEAVFDISSAPLEAPEEGGSPEAEAEILTAAPLPVPIVSKKAPAPLLLRPVHAGPDRRILKAFYTQYVGVLLIILTFTVGAFQRTLNVSSGTIVPAPKGAEPAPFGTVEIPRLFENGSLLGSTAKLDAVAAVLLNHDVNADITMELPRLAVAAGTPSFERALLRVEQLERYFTHKGVPAAAVRITVSEGSNETSATVRFAPVPKEQP